MPETLPLSWWRRCLNCAKHLKHLKKARYVLTKKERRLVKILAGIAALSLLVVVWQFIGNHTRAIAQEGGNYSEGIYGKPEYINPILAQTNDPDMDLSELIFSGLMRYNGKQELVTDLAKDFPEVSEDQKNYIFHLREGIKWHDGEPLTADDVLFTVQSIKNQEWQSPLYPNFSSVAVEKVDDLTIKFTLVKEAFSPFLKENTTFGILPRHLWENVLPKNAALSELNAKPVGSGPYKVESFAKDKKTELVTSYKFIRNEDFYLGKPYLKEINLFFYEDYQELINAYNKNDIDGIGYIPATLRTEISDASDINFYNPGLPRYYAVFLNGKKNKNLQEDAVRQALANSVDRERIIRDVLDGQAELVNTPILPNFLGHNPEVKVYNFDPDLANKTLHDAGWNKIDEEGYRWQDGTRLELTIMATDQEQFAKIAEILAESWKQIGVKTNIETFDPTTLQTEYIKPREYEALLFGQLIGHDPDPYVFWHSSQRSDPGLNLTSYHEDAIDRLLDEARKTSDENERLMKYLDFQNRLAEATPAIFLYSPTYSYGVADKIKGIDLAYISLPSDRFTDIFQWHINTKRVWGK